jgi:hypothetical protein
MRSAVARAVISLVALFLAAGACAKSATSSARTLSIVSPSEGATVDSPVDFVFSVKGVQIGPPETGKMHFHIHIDGSSKYLVVTSTQASIPIPAGQHTIKVVIAQPNHDETGTFASVTITVAAGGATPSPTGYAGGYGGYTP